MKKIKARCYDCKRLYGSHGFPDLIIPNDVWRIISPTKDEGGLLCPSCICERLGKKKIKCYGAFMSGPIISSTEMEMHTFRWMENLRETVEGAGIEWTSPLNKKK